MDHGIELPERRVELGKPAEGVLTLHALYEGGQVSIEIADDARASMPNAPGRKPSSGEPSLCSHLMFLLMPLQATALSRAASTSL